MALHRHDPRGRGDSRTGGATSHSRQGSERTVHIGREGPQPDGHGVRLVLDHIHQHRPPFVAGPPQDDLIAPGPNARDEQDRLTRRVAAGDRVLLRERSNETDANCEKRLSGAARVDDAQREAARGNRGGRRCLVRTCRDRDTESDDRTTPGNPLRNKTHATPDHFEIPACSHAKSAPSTADCAAQPAKGHPSAFLRSATICASSAAVSCVSANATGHTCPSSSLALSLKPIVAYRVLNFFASWKWQTTLPSFE